MDQPINLQEDEVNLLDYWRVVWKRRRLIGGLFVSAVLTALVVSLLMPKIYESTATLLPSLESKDGGGLGALLAASGAGGTAQSLGISLPGAPATPTDLFVAMLKSRIMADAVITRFNLMDLYEAKTMQDTRKALEGDTRVTVAKEKVIKITVEAKSPPLAADIANFYVSNLDRLNRTLNVRKGGKGMLPGDRLHPAMVTVPGLALEYGRLMREVKVQETLYSLLTSQNEQAKIAEARDTPTVQVLDPAIPAEKKSKPSIRLNMLIAGVLALFVGFFLAFFLEYLERIRIREAQDSGLRTQD